jgi:hypothetical protein
MKNVEMTDLQRQSLEHLERARREGLSVKAYARAHGIPAQRIYDAVARLRRRGALPDHSVKRGKFIAVKIAPPPLISNATVCRMLVPGGLVIECLQWPPRTWLESMARTPDAAT